MKKTTRKVLIWVGVSLLAVIFLPIIIGVIIGGSSPSTETSTAKEPIKKEAAESQPIIESTEPDVSQSQPSNWDYSEEKDPMTDKVRYFAQCASLNQMDFKFPYDGGSTLYILIRKMNGKNEVLLQISKGQFMSSYTSNVKIKFDNGSVHTYEFDEPADASGDYIFLHSPQSLIQKLKQSKSVKIQPQFYQEGQTVFDFNTEGLKWNH